MEVISNSPFTDVSSQFSRPVVSQAGLVLMISGSQGEFARLSQTCIGEKVDLPGPKELAKVKEQLAKHKEYIMTEVSVARAMDLRLFPR